MLLPTFTLPKDSCAGVTESWPFDGVVVPLPSSGTVAGSLAPTTSIVRFPEAFPDAVGLNETAISVLCPGASSKFDVLGVENPVPVALTCDTVMLAPPASVEFVSEMCMVLVVFNATLPKSKLETLSPTWVDACVPVPLLAVLALSDCSKLHPERMSTAASVITAMAAFCQWRGGVIVSRITYDYLDPG